MLNGKSNLESISYLRQDILWLTTLQSRKCCCFSKQSNCYNCTYHCLKLNQYCCVFWHIYIHTINMVLQNRNNAFTCIHVRNNLWLLLYIWVNEQNHKTWCAQKQVTHACSSRKKVLHFYYSKTIIYYSTIVWTIVIFLCTLVHHGQNTVQPW